MRRTAVAAAFLAALALAPGVRTEAEVAQPWARKMAAGMAKVTSQLRRISGPDWMISPFPAKQQAEIRWALKEQERLREQIDRLNRRSAALDVAESRVLSAQGEIDEEDARIKREEPPLIAEIDAHNARVAQFHADATRHESNPPNASDQASVDRYNREADELNARRGPLNDQGKRLEDQRQAMISDKSALARRRSEMDVARANNRRSRQALEADTLRCEQECEALNARALTLAQALAKQGPRPGARG